MLIAASVTGQAQAPEPGAAEQKGLLEKIRDQVSHYAERLEDFLCVEAVKRSAQNGDAPNGWRELDTQEREVGYIAGQERARELTVNGKPAGPKNQIVPGYFLPGGEFSRPLQQIFEPKAKAQFEWDHAEQAGSRRLCVFRYRVARGNSTLSMNSQYGRLLLSHQGLVWADCDTGLPMGLKIESEERSFHAKVFFTVATAWGIDLRYGMTTIEGKEFLLPESAEESSVFGSTHVKAEVQFRDYRKYDASSAISFDPEPKP